MGFRPYRPILVTAILFLMLSMAAWAQGVASITGIVSDPSGAIVPKAQVSLTNDATGASYKTETTPAGLYRFSQLPVVGTYTLSVDMQGFAPFKATSINVSVGTTTTFDVALTLGKSAEVVDVSAAEQLVQPSESQVSQLIDRRIWESMPNSTRDSNSFVNLVAGATPDTGSTRGASVNGARGGTGNFLVEGLDNNDQGQGGRGQTSPDTDGGAVTSISPDAIQEYRVITSNFSAEFGKAGGFVTDTVLKSGTNNYHGSAYEYNRVQALAANNFFTNRSEDPFNPGHHQNDSLVRNQFGGSIGGPVVKDKTFFFATGEVHRRRSSTVTTASGLNSDFLNWVNSGGLQQWAESDPLGICMRNTGAACPGAFANSATTGPVFNQLINASPFPLGNGPDRPCLDPATTPIAVLTNPSANPCAGEGAWSGNALGVRGLQRSVFPMSPFRNLSIQDPSFLNEYRLSTKFDHKFTDKDQINAVYLLQDADSGSKFDGGDTTIGPSFDDRARSQNAGVTWNHTFSPTFMNTFKASYLRHVQNFPETEPGMPSVVTALDELGVGLGMSAGLPQFFTDNQFQFQNHLTLVHGKQTFKFGGEYRRTRNGSSFFNAAKGQYLPYDVENLLTDMAFGDEADNAVAGGPFLGSLFSATAGVDLTTGKAPDYYRGYRANEFAGYFQDDWRIAQRLTVNLGLRWEYFGPPHNFKENIDSNFFFGTNVAPFNTVSSNPYFPSNDPFYAAVSSGTFQIRNNEIWNKDTNNFSPRAGFAWDVLGNQKLVMRAGAAIAYDRVYNNIFENIRFNPPFFSANQIGAVINGVPAGALSTPGIYSYPFNSLAVFNDPAFAPKPNPRHMDQNLVTPYYEQVHFGFQYEFAKGYMFQPEYVGTFGHKLIGIRDINTFDGRRAGGDSTRINTTIGADNYRSNDYSSNYHGLQMTVRKSYSMGLQFNSAYTWSKSMDTISDAFNSRTGASVSDPMNIRYDYGPSDFDVRHRWVTSVSYDLPFMKNNRLLGGWSLNSILQFQSGLPYNLTDGGNDLNANGIFNDRVVTTGAAPMSTTVPLNLNLNQGFGGTVSYFDPNQWQDYTCTVNNGDWCNAPIGRNAMTGPGFQKIDFGVNKKFVVKEGMNLTFQANMFNLFNHTNFKTPVANLSNSNFGQIISANDARQTQLALRFEF